ncbi:MAG TPA: methyltransferase domain-containing protein, partial [Caulobacteraceae bacterium]|nr:methyltransferase domain-containing protein [Caulobacteraceae bacterium]
MSHYAIAGGQAGNERLHLLARVMQPTTAQLLAAAGLGPGMRCLDVGCGGGHVTLMMARSVGPHGGVVGIDQDGAILALARRDAEAARLDNVRFRQADAVDTQEEGAYDLAYARFVLTHLDEPEACLAAMARACRPRGMMVIEDIDFSGSFCHPPCAAYARYTALYQEVVARRGGDPNIGPKLPGMLRQAGAEEIRVNVVQPTHMEGEGKLMAAVTMEKIAGAVVAEGLAAEA